MSFENASITWGAKQLAAMVKNERIVFTNLVQRGLVWERARKSGLIESTIISVPIPAVYARRFDDGSGKRNSNVYDIMDGKQRLSTIASFINDEFALTDLPPVTYYDELTDTDETVDISGMKFSDLPEGLQEKVKNARISVIYFDNLTNEESKELFKRLNAGKPLSAKSRTLASCKDIEGLLNIGSHKLFSSTDGMLIEKAIENKNQAVLVMKCWCMMNQDIQDVSFESKVFNPLLENTEITETEKLALIEVFDLIFDTHYNLIERKEKKVAKKLFTETHMVSLIPYFKKAVEAGIDENLMADWIVDFFKTDDGASVSEDYNMAATSGVSKNMNIQTRDKALADSYAEFFKMDEDGAEDNTEVNEEVDSESVEESEETVDSENDVNDGYESFAESIMADSEEHEA